MSDLISLLGRPETSIAVVGATDNPRKFGNRIYRDLKSKGYRVLAVNPNRETVDGDRAYAGLAELPERPTIVDYVIPPPSTLQVLHRARELGLLNAWIQPGARTPPSSATSRTTASPT